MKWLSERGLLRREGQQSYPEFKQEPISDLKASTITAGLNGGVAAVQIEALRDFTHLSHRHIVLDREDIASPVSRILRGGTTEEVKLNCRCAAERRALGAGPGDATGHGLVRSNRGTGA